MSTIKNSFNIIKLFTVICFAVFSVQSCNTEPVEKVEIVDVTDKFLVYYHLFLRHRINIKNLTLTEHF